jgi:squalene-associated FAD-dependent desaturase
LPNSKSHIAIIGGGCAGLSAAMALVERGLTVTLFEASPYLGGRARTVETKQHALDNGQHILLGAYRETLALLRKAGVHIDQSFLRLPLHINMQSIQGHSAFRLKSAKLLPAPLHLLFGLLGCHGLSWQDRIAAIKLMLHLKKTNYGLAQDTPLDSFLMAQKQTANLTRMLWEPLCLAALNTPIAKASTRIFLNVLRDSFSGHQSNSDFLLPRQDLSKIIAQPLARYIANKGGVINLNQAVLRLETKKNSLGQDGFNVETAHGSHFFTDVIIASAPSNVSKLLQSLPLVDNIREVTHIYQYQPIYTIYLQYPESTQLPQVMSGLCHTSGQWVFDRGQLCGQLGLLSVVVSASGEHQRLTQSQLALLVTHELKLAYPNLPKPLWHKVIAEKRATFSCDAMLDRPSNQTLQPHLYLAGDYTYADYPASIEGAVRSGLLCASLIASEGLKTNQLN